MNNTNTIGDILKVEDSRVEALVQICYKKLDEVRQNKSERPMSEVIECLVKEGQTIEEKFILGFTLGRIYQSNAVELDKVAQTAERMFG